jgi:wyosine [tRNA(Phe)-imidazoG37] synthetase (radical SAM superfamily)
MKYVYGPVKSRRLGRSLGVSLVPYKVCPFDCVYCQLKRTTVRTRRRALYVDPQAVLEELRSFFEGGQKREIDVVAFSGSGEPTLNTAIGRLIRATKRLTRVPVAVITNSATLLAPQVRRELLSADIVIPSLDAATQEVFLGVDRPAAGIKVKAVIGALVKFRRAFKHEMRLEVMLVRGLNDSPEHLAALKAAIARIRPDRVELNSPVRLPAEPWVRPLSRQALRRVQKFLGPGTDIV